MLAKSLFAALKKEGITPTVISTGVNGTKYEARNGKEALVFNVNDQGCTDYVRAFKYDPEYSYAENYDRGVFALTLRSAIMMLMNRY